MQAEETHVPHPLQNTSLWDFRGAGQGDWVSISQVHLAVTARKSRFLDSADAPLGMTTALGENSGQPAGEEEPHFSPNGD
jgi:hypothetical protein